ncbi:hypothetical protein, partial [Pasteurella multocida]|uniref:hypothetical protein n=1 Tax=Pasteurella multocida TaxID=747 RepID=UPI0017D9C71A
MINSQFTKHCKISSTREGEGETGGAPQSRTGSHRADCTKRIAVKEEGGKKEGNDRLILNREKQKGIKKGGNMYNVIWREGERKGKRKKGGERGGRRGREKKGKGEGERKKKGERGEGGREKRIE